MGADMFAQALTKPGSHAILGNCRSDSSSQQVVLSPTCGLSLLVNPAYVKTFDPGLLSKLCH